MKKHWLLLVATCVAVAFSASCSTEVDLFDGGEDAPIIYALLDLDADTNYVKITHTMAAVGSPENTHNPALIDYPGKLDVRLTEFCNGDSVRQFVLDTITIRNKEEGLFYAPEQKLYYFTERLKSNKAGESYSYRLTVALPDHVATADADAVGNDRFYIRSSVADFSGGNIFNAKNDASAANEIWFLPAENAGIYKVNMSFTFFERRTWTSDTVPRTISWHLGTFYQFFLAQHMHGDAYIVSYSATDLFRQLNDYLGDDTLVPGLRRYLDDYPIQVTVSAGDRNLEEYVYFYEMSPAENPENVVPYIDGAYGVFSTIKTIEREMRLGGTTVPELLETKWGFKYVGGHLGTE